MLLFSKFTSSSQRRFYSRKKYFDLGNVKNNILSTVDKIKSDVPTKVNSTKNNKSINDNLKQIASNYYCIRKKYTIANITEQMKIQKKKVIMLLIKIIIGLLIITFIFKFCYHSMDFIIDKIFEGNSPE